MAIQLTGLQLRRGDGPQLLLQFDDSNMADIEVDSIGNLIFDAAVGDITVRSNSFRVQAGDDDDAKVLLVGKGIATENVIDSNLNLRVNQSSIRSMTFLPNRIDLAVDGMSFNGGDMRLRSEGVNIARFHDDVNTDIFVRLDGNLGTVQAGFEIRAQGSGTDFTRAMMKVQGTEVQFRATANGAPAAPLTAFRFSDVPVFFAFDITVPNINAERAILGRADGGAMLIVQDLGAVDPTDLINYISFQDQVPTEIGFVGYGSTGSTDFTVRSSLGNVILNPAGDTQLFAAGGLRLTIGSPTSTLSGHFVPDTTVNARTLGNAGQIWGSIDVNKVFLGAGSPTAPTITNRADSSSGLFFNATDNLAASHDGVMIWQINNNGFLPGGTTTFDLGSDANKWRNVYAVNAILTGAVSFTGNAANPGDATATVYNQSGVGPTISGLHFEVRTGSVPTRRLYLDGNTTVLSAHVHIIPDVDDSRNLGSSSLGWNTTYTRKLWDTLLSAGALTALQTTSFSKTLFFGRNVKYTGAGSPYAAENWEYLESDAGNNQQGGALIIGANSAMTLQFWSTMASSPGGGSPVAIISQLWGVNQNGSDPQAAYSIHRNIRTFGDGLGIIGTDTARFNTGYFDNLVVTNPPWPTGGTEIVLVADVVISGSVVAGARDFAAVNNGAILATDSCSIVLTAQLGDSQFCYYAFLGVGGVTVYAGNIDSSTRNVNATVRVTVFR